MQSLLRQAGWPENLIVTMAAIGMAESGGRECVIGTLANNEYSVGIWQININPALKRPWTKTQLCDPLFNARVAFQIYGQQGLKAWGAYTNGSYRKYLPASQTVYQPNASPVPPTLDNTRTVDDTPVNTKILIGAGAVLIALLIIR